MLPERIGFYTPGIHPFIEAVHQRPFAGTVEPGESCADAVIREMQEEVALTVTPIRQLFHWTHPKRKLQLAWWSLSEESQPPTTPNPAEVAQTQWLTPNQLHPLSPMTPGNKAFLTALQDGQANLH